MLCTSLELFPSPDTVGDGTIDVLSTSTPLYSVEHLRNVYVCASSPAVTETWLHCCSHAPCVLISGGRTRQISAEANSRTNDTTHRVNSKESFAPTVAVPLTELVESYTISDSSSSSTRAGASFVQVLALGAHSGLTVEAKAVVAGGVMAVLRARLAQLLRLHANIWKAEWNASHDAPQEEAGQAGLLSALKLYCQFQRTSSSSSSFPYGTVPENPNNCEDEGNQETVHHERSGTWCVKWTPQLLCQVAASLSENFAHDDHHISVAPMALKVTQCKDLLRSSVESSLRTRLQRDRCAAPEQLTAAQATRKESTLSEDDSGNAATHTPVQRNVSQRDSLTVVWTACTVVRTHPLDVQRAIELGCCLYRTYIVPAQEHAEDGTEAFKELLQLSQGNSQHQSSRDRQKGDSADGLRVLWQRALDRYHRSAVAAQKGVLFLLQHDVTAHGANAGVEALSMASSSTSLAKLRSAEVRARVQVAQAQQTANALRYTGAEVDVLHPLYLRSDSSSQSSRNAYVNRVLLTQPWDPRVMATMQAASWAGLNALATLVQRTGTECAEGDGGEERRDADLTVLAPAVAALQWRAPLKPLGTDVCVSDSVAAAEKNVGGATATRGQAWGGPTLQPTPLQWMFYTLRRQLLVAVANTAQVLLTGDRLGFAPAPSSMRAQADCCVKAQGLLRDFMKWHSPFPSLQASPSLLSPALCLSSSPSSSSLSCSTLSKAARVELLWCLRLLGKLHLRAAALYGVLGDVAAQRDQERRWRDQLQRWASRRTMQQQKQQQQRKTTTTTATAAAATVMMEGEEQRKAATPAMSFVLEDVVGHLDDVTWAAFVQEVSVGLPATR